MSGYGTGIGEAIVILAISTFILGSVIVGGIWYFTSKDYIESKTPITPEIKLTTDGKTIDTLYVYKPIE